MDTIILYNLNLWKSRPTKQELEFKKQDEHKKRLDIKIKNMFQKIPKCIYCLTPKNVYAKYKYNDILHTRLVYDYRFKCAFEFYLPCAYLNGGIQQTEKMFIVCSNRKFPLHITHLIYSFIDRHLFFY